MQEGFEKKLNGAQKTQVIIKRSEPKSFLNYNKKNGAQILYRNFLKKLDKRIFMCYNQLANRKA